jgi:DNA helicase-2/ATP-dependent DNA helicase PcrA
MLVLAGAGSGKTYVYVRRMFKLIKQDAVDPRKILGLTFSKKAAKEIKNRLESLQLENNINISTFHSFGYELIKSFPELCGKIINSETKPSLVDDDDLKKFTKEIIIDSLGKRIETVPYKRWLRLIDFSQNCGILISRYHSNNYTFFKEIYNSEVNSAKESEIEDAWNFGCLLEEKKESLNLITYNDLILLPMIALESSTALAKTVAAMYQYIFIDEFQDTSIAQYRMIKAIAKYMGNTPNIMAVGDDDQSIYEWRGAKPENLSIFEKDFNAKTIRLEHNYRSANEIVKVTSRHIQHNILRMGKKPFSTKLNDEKAVFIMDSENEKEMARQIVQNIKNEMNKGCEPKDIAILFRLSYLSNNIESELRINGIPSLTVGIKSIFDSKEIKLALSIIRLMINKRDIIALGNISEILPGLGKASIQKIRKELENDSDISLWTAANRCFNQKSKSLLILSDLYKELSMKYIDGPDNLYKWVWDGDYFKLQDFFKVKMRESDEEVATRSSKLELLQNIINEELDYSSVNEDHEKWSVLIDVMLSNNDGYDKDKNKNAVTLSTIHRAKGLEWPVVHIPAFVQGVMPMDVRMDDLQKMEGELKHNEEERRISYVALTRAERALYLYCPRSMYVYDGVKSFGRSPFLDELGQINS